ncbi:1916_t:CDS:2, partial [Ambispora leptoticha]
MAAAVVVSLGVSIVSLAVALGNNIVKQNQDKQNQEHVLIHDDSGWKNLNPYECVVFSFRPNIWGTTHFWCTVKSQGIHKTFPLYGE